MRVFCVCVARDEADIIGYALDSALEWAQSIYVLDNGSTDGTWELVNDYAQRDERVVVVGRDEGAFRNALRGEVVNRAPHGAKKGDWWCRLDADEIYVGDPREVLERIAPGHALVYKASIEYFFTDRDLSVFEKDPAGYVDTWSPERLRYYRAWWSEIRFVRHFPGRTWDGAWPRGVKNLKGSTDRILVRHYPHRNPWQIEKRLHIRLGSTEERAFRHEKVAYWNPLGRESDLAFPRAAASGALSWKSRVYRADVLHFDDGSGGYVIDSDMMPAVQPGRPPIKRVYYFLRDRVAAIRSAVGRRG